MSGIDGVLGVGADDEELEDELRAAPADEVGVDATEVVGFEGVGVDGEVEGDDEPGAGAAVMKGLQVVARLLILLKLSDPVPAKTPNIAALAEESERSAE